jgi:hypothetical protein
MRRYIDLVLAEIEASRRLNTAPLQTIFFGGGEPAGTKRAMLVEPHPIPLLNTRLLLEKATLSSPLFAPHWR